MEYVYEMPGEMLEKCDKAGKVERFEYDSFTYEEDNKPLHKGAWVYLPYGYDEGKKYNVLYLLHGGFVTEDWWFVTYPDTVTILDNMMAKGLCEPCIIVTPTYYRGDEEADRQAEHITEHFRTELRKDLIPAVEAHYATYAGKDVSEENLIRTREHRAFAGLSLGSMTTYRAAFYNNFDLFAWYGPFSGCGGPKGDRDEEVKRICETLKKGEEAGLALKYMFCGNGDADIAYAEHSEIMGKALEVCPQLKKGENYDFYVIPGGVHDMKAWQLHLYHALQLFFR
ncbi:MAG: esterase family protein [Lachnospiraceae bacterium]|nr:esterase family protein [Lachnospiraceae bacterium]